MVRNLKFCADPLKRHKKKIIKYVFPASDSLVAKCNGKILKGTLLCSNCSKVISQNSGLLEEMNAEFVSDTVSISSEFSSTSNTSNDTEFVTGNLCTILPLLQETPIKKKGLSVAQKLVKGNHKLEKVTVALKRKFEESYGIEISQTPESEAQLTTSQKLEKYEHLMMELKNAFLMCNDYKKKLQILTLSPFTINETANFFQATKHMVKKSRNLKKEYGVLPEVPKMSKGRVITEKQKKAIQEFYDLDDVSRSCPGQKDCLVIRDNLGRKVTMQKRMVLGNLKELFELYKEDPKNPKVGFSTFASLRPQYCVLPLSGGTHSVCVCTYHQNPKLQLAALGESGLTYKDLIEYSVCSIDNTECMMQECKYCPREVGVKAFLELLESVDSAPDEIRYKQWVTTDRCTMIEKVEPLNMFLISLSLSISNLTRHHFVAQRQSQFFKELKDSLTRNEVLIVGDFSENYSFVVQDAVQGFHWENSQCTVHPFVIYWKEVSTQEVMHSSYCFLSDLTKHSTVMVYAFLECLLPEIKLTHPQIKKVHYFSDGCAGQYKNRFNFTNLCHHEEDYGLSCEWHFFATSHGKNACDGIGGTVKRATARASMQRVANKQILTPEDMFNFCRQNLSKNIKFYFVSSEDVKKTDSKLKSRFEGSQTIFGTQKCHRFVPINKHTIMAYKISSDTVGEQKIVQKKNGGQLEQRVFVKKEELKIGQFLGCVYASNLWFGILQNYSKEFDDYSINFLHPAGMGSSFTFPETKDECDVPYENIVGVMSTPSLHGGSRINYIFNRVEMEECFQKAEIVASYTR